MKLSLILMLGVMLLASTAFAGPPTPRRAPSVLDIPPQGPPPVYGFAGPSTRWGWFGVQYRERQVHHRTFYNNAMVSGYRYGY